MSSIPDGMPSVTEKQAPRDAPDGLPQWSIALPLWAAQRWLWIRALPGGLYMHRTGGASADAAWSRSMSLQFLASERGAYALIVLDCQRVRSMPDTEWPRLRDALSQGGALFVCGPLSKGLLRRICLAAPGLAPGGWHRIAPDEEGGWNLHPANRALRRLVYGQLHPAYTLRSWLAQMRGRAMPLPGELRCLLLWRGEGQ